MRAWLTSTVLVLTLSIPSVRAFAQGSADVPDIGSLPELRELTGERSKVVRPTSTVMQAGAVNADRYIVGPGDQLELTLWGRVARTTSLTVSPEGRILLPGRAAMDVGGKTLAATRERVLKAINDQYLGVHADLQLVGLRRFKVYVTGQVERPGAVEATSTMRASEVLAPAGLLAKASHRNIVLTRLDGSTVHVDLDAAQTLGRQDADPQLIDGDVINVPYSTLRAAVGGAVSNPREIELAHGDDIATLVALGGGLIPAATPERAFMVRFTSASERESLAVDVGQAEVLKRPIQDGDRLYIQYRPDYHFLPSVDIAGDVEHPGSFPITPGRDRLTDVLGWAGGFRATANKAAVHLIRDVEISKVQDPEFERLARLSRNEMTESEYIKLETKLAERKNTFTIDWNRLEPGSANDPLLQDRDVVRVDRFVPTVRIEGQVKRPGYVDYAPGRSLGEYIQLAGGFTDRSARTGVRVSRSLTGQIIPARSLRGVLPGDFIWVPERKDFDAWTSFRDIITVAGQVAVVIFTLSR